MKDMWLLLIVNKKKQKDGRGGYIIFEIENDTVIEDASMLQ